VGCALPRFLDDLFEPTAAFLVEGLIQFVEFCRIQSPMASQSWSIEELGLGIFVFSRKLGKRKLTADSGWGWQGSRSSRV